MKLVANTLLILIYILAAVAHGNPPDTPAVTHFHSSSLVSCPFMTTPSLSSPSTPFGKRIAMLIIPHGVSDPGAMTAGPLPPPEPANYADESSDDEVDGEEDGDEDDSEEDSVLPPTFRRQPGRPRKERTEAEKERRRLWRGIVRRVQKCRLCHAVGHSKRTCKGPPV